MVYCIFRVFIPVFFSTIRSKLKTISQWNIDALMNQKKKKNPNYAYIHSVHSYYTYALKSLTLASDAVLRQRTRV